MKRILLGCLILIASATYAQLKVSGIVVDSVTFQSLPNVHIKIKGKSGGAVTNENGFFNLNVSAFDTLLFSRVGYLPVLFPVVIDEEDVLIRMAEDVTYLQTVIVTGAPILSPLIQPKKSVVYRKPVSEKMFTGSGISFSYFSREQKEKRKLLRVIEANERVAAYTNVITDLSFKMEIMKKYSIPEKTYYQYVLNFNTTHLSTIENKSEEEVVRILDRYFCRISRKCD